MGDEAVVFDGESEFEVLRFSIEEEGELKRVDAVLRMPEDQWEAFLGVYASEADRVSVSSDAAPWEGEREMVITGAPFWSRDGEHRKVKLNLRDPGLADESTGYSVHPLTIPQGNMMNNLSRMSALLDVLLLALEDEGVLSEEQVEGLRERADEEAWQLKFYFLECEDAEALS